MKKIINGILMLALISSTYSSAYIYRVCKNGTGGYTSTGYGTHFGQPRSFDTDEDSIGMRDIDDYEERASWCKSYEVSPAMYAKYYHYKPRQGGQLQPTFLHGGALEVGPTSGQITGSDGQGWGPRQ